MREWRRFLNFLGDLLPSWACPILRFGGCCSSLSCVVFPAADVPLGLQLDTLMTRLAHSWTFPKYVPSGSLFSQPLPPLQLYSDGQERCDIDVSYALGQRGSLNSWNLTHKDHLKVRSARWSSEECQTGGGIGNYYSCCLCQSQEG